MDDVIYDLRKSFRQVTYCFDKLRTANAMDVTDTFLELDTALINFDMDLDSFLQEIKEENKDE